MVRINKTFFLMECPGYEQKTTRVLSMFDVSSEVFFNDVLILN